MTSIKLNRVPGNPELFMVSADLKNSSGSQATVPLLLDTGASYTFISFAIAGSYGFKKTGNSQKIKMGKGDAMFEEYIVPYFKCVGKNYQNFKTYSNHQYFPGNYIQGVLGMDFLQHYGLNLKRGIIWESK